MEAPTTATGERPDGLFERALGTAYRYLGKRERTTAEITRRLQRAADRSAYRPGDARTELRYSAAKLGSHAASLTVRICSSLASRGMTLL